VAQSPNVELLTYRSLPTGMNFPLLMTLWICCLPRLWRTARSIGTGGWRRIRLPIPPRRLASTPIALRSTPKTAIVISPTVGSHDVRQFERLRPGFPRSFMA